MKIFGILFYSFFILGAIFFIYFWISSNFGFEIAFINYIGDIHLIFVIILLSTIFFFIIFPFWLYQEFEKIRKKFVYEKNLIKNDLVSLLYCFILGILYVPFIYNMITI